MTVAHNQNVCPHPWLMPIKHPNLSCLVAMLPPHSGGHVLFPVTPKSPCMLSHHPPVPVLRWHHGHCAPATPRWSCANWWNTVVSVLSPHPGGWVLFVTCAPVTHWWLGADCCATTVSTMSPPWWLCFPVTPRSLCSHHPLVVGCWLLCHDGLRNLTTLMAVLSCDTKVTVLPPPLGGWVLIVVPPRSPWSHHPDGCALLWHHGHCATATPWWLSTIRCDTMVTLNSLDPGSSAANPVYHTPDCSSSSSFPSSSDAILTPAVYSLQ